MSETTNGQSSEPARPVNPEPTPEAEHPTPVPRIYVASLSDYNAGRLHGTWLEATSDIDELHQGIQAMLTSSKEPGAEEWAIHDYEGFGSMHLSEYASMETIARLGQGIAEYGLAYAAWAEHCDRDLNRLAQFPEAYRGHWNSVTEYAEEMLDELGAPHLLESLPDWLAPYAELRIDAFAHDLEISGDILTSPATTDGHLNGVYVFDGLL